MAISERFRIKSLKGKIRLVFLIALILLMLLFGVLWKSSTTAALQRLEMQERANIHYIYLYFLKYGKIDEAYLKSQNIRIVDAGGKDMKLLHKLDPSAGGEKFAVTHLKLHRYILINNDRFKIVLENLNHLRYPLELVMAFAGALALLLMLYIWVVRSISPLFELKEKIILFSEGSSDISCKSDREDEIAEVANAFDEAVKKIRDLLHSRQLLLRAIMHELKTPIAKGRLLCEMIDDERMKQRFLAIFERLNLLIDEFAKVEKITSRNLSTDFRPYKMSDIVDASVDMLMLDERERYLHIVVSRDFTVNADFELLTLAIKNLIDNAIKYSPDKRADILIRDKILTISNEGEPLSGNLEEYFKPFHRGTGLGLGLYIVKSIFDLHSASLNYSHEGGVNRFETIFPDEMGRERV